MQYKMNILIITKGMKGMKGSFFLWSFEKIKIPIFTFQISKKKKSQKYPSYPSQPSDG